MTLQRHRSWAIRRTLLEYEEGSLEKTALYKSFSANFPFTFFFLHFSSPTPFEKEKQKQQQNTPLFGVEWEPVTLIH